jgi:hypothetical protein
MQIEEISYKKNRPGLKNYRASILDNANVSPTDQYQNIDAISTMQKL